MVYHLKAEGKIVLGSEIESISIVTREKLHGWPFGMEKLDGWHFGCGWAIRDWLMDN